MKITDLLSTSAIKLNGVAHSKEEVINQMVDLMANNGNIINKEQLELEKESQYHMEKQMQFQNRDYQQW